MTGEGIYYAVATGHPRRPRRGRGGRRAGDPAGPAGCTAASVRRLLGRHLRHTWVAVAALPGRPPSSTPASAPPAATSASSTTSSRSASATAASPPARRRAGRRPRRRPSPDRPRPRPAERSRACEILSVRGALPEHRYPQAEITDAFAAADRRGAASTSGCCAGSTRNAGVRARGTWRCRWSEYAGLDDFGAANDLFIEHGRRAGRAGRRDALKAAGLTPDGRRPDRLAPR